MRARLSVLVIACLALATSARGVSQVRDRPAGNEIVVPAGIVEGRVDAGTPTQPAPVRRARVTLVGPSVRPLTAETDIEGKFRFESVPVGQYDANVEKPGFMMRERVSVDVLLRQTASLAIAMNRGAALEGRVLTLEGKPGADLVISADRLRDDGSSVLHWERTDGLGRFRMHTLPAGRYRVHVQAPPGTNVDEIYFPGTPNESEARVLTLTPGETLDRLDFVVVPRPPAAPEDAQPVEAPIELRPDNVAPQLSGRITSADGDRPLAGADVSLQCAPHPTRAATTDADGRFVFQNVPAGTCGMFVAAEGHVKPQSGANARPNKMVDVRAGESIRAPDLTLQPLHAIEGRVVDEFGDGVPSAVILVMRRAIVDGRPQMAPPVPSVSPASRTGTDDRGWFRIEGLVPGDYYLTARTGLFAGANSPRVSPAFVSTGGFAPTYFPGVRSFGDASAISVSASADTVGVSLPMVPAAMMTVNCSVVDETGRLVTNASVLLTAPSDRGGMSLFSGSTQTTNGRVRFDRVPDGTYQLSANGLDFAGNSTLVVQPSEESIAVTLPVRRLTRARGTVLFEGGARPERVTAMVTPVGSDPTNALYAQSAPVDAAGNFETKQSLREGLLRVAAPGWAVQRVVLNGQDVTDTPLNFQGDDVNGLQVTMTNRLGGVTGAVMDGDARTADAVVLVFSANPAHWNQWSRFFLRALVSPAAGTFALRDLLPGDYLALGVDPFRALPPQFDAALLTRFRSSATPFTVSEGTTASVTLTLVKP